MFVTTQVKLMNFDCTMVFITKNYINKKQFQIQIYQKNDFYN